MCIVNFVTFDFFKYNFNTSYDIQYFITFPTVLIFSSYCGLAFIGLHQRSGLFEHFQAIRNLLLLEHEQQVILLVQFCSRLWKQNGKRRL